MTAENEIPSKENKAAEAAAASEKAVAAANLSKGKESEVYDRQIRLWGADAQAKMSKAKVLYVHVTGATSEILKNLVLAGIRATVWDPRPYPDAVLDTPSMFTRQQLLQENRKNDNDGTNNNNSNPKRIKFESVAHAMRSVIEELNPLLGDCDVLHAETLENLIEMGNLSQYTAIVASRIGKKHAVAFAEIMARSGGTFYMVDSFGYYGASAFDLGPKYQYRPEKGKELMDVKSLSNYVSLKDTLDVPLDQVTNRFHKTPPEAWVYYQCLLHYLEAKQPASSSWPLCDNDEKIKYFVETTRSWLKETSPKLLELDCTSEASLKQLAKTGHREIAPVCAVLGGLIGNEVIKAISGKGEPANNTMLFDGQSCKALSFLVKPKNYR